MNRFKLISTILFLCNIILFDITLAQDASPSKAEKKENNNVFQQIDVADTSVNSSFLQASFLSEIKYDSSEIKVRSIDSAKILIHLKDKDFQYFKDPEYSKTLWERIMDWIRRQFAKLSQYDSYYTAWDIVMYILIALAVAAIIFGIYRSEFKGLLISNKKNTNLNVSESSEDIHSFEYDKLIEDAIASKNFRYAVRLNYLRTLKTLSDKKIINWKNDKTNNDFINEIKHLSIKEKFKKITTDFEYIWYGEYEIDQISYNSLVNNYSDFNSNLETV